MALRLPGRVFLHLKNVPVDARDLHRNIVQMQLRLTEGNIDADAHNRAAAERFAVNINR